MEDKKFPTLFIKYETDLELIEIILKIYSLGNGITLQPFLLRVLKYYIKYGYTDQAKEYLMEDEKRTEIDIRVANTNLRDLGFLMHGEKNLRKSKLSKDMEYIRKSFLEDKKSLYALVFQRA